MENVELIKCANCGEEIMEDNPLYCHVSVDHIGECCKDNVEKCDNCDEWFLSDDLLSVDRGSLSWCEDCFSDYGFICNDCGDQFSGDGNRTDDDNLVCDRCLRNNYITCDWCDSTVHSDNSYYDGDITLCGSCRDNAYVCDSCGCFLSGDNVFTPEHGGGAYCESCYLDVEDNEEERGTFDSRIKFYDAGVSPSRNPLQMKDYFGIEIEFDDCKKNIDITGDLYDLLNGWGTLKTDGSLNNGKELNMPPMTEEYLAGPGFEKIESVCRIIQKDCQLWTAKSAGIHIHNNRGDISSDAEAGLIYLFWAEREKISKLAGRHWDSTQVRRYASYTAHIDEAGGYGTYEIKGLIGSGRHKRHSRYCAVNFNPSETIEFRPFQSTGRPESILGYFGLVKMARKFSTIVPIEDMIKFKINNNLFGSFRDYVEGSFGPLASALNDHIKYKGV